MPTRGEIIKFADETVILYQHYDCDILKQLAEEEMNNLKTVVRLQILNN